MRRVKKDSLVQRVANALRDDLGVGKWVDFLPGLRELARVYGVSVPTVRMALSLLVDEGLLEMAGAKRRTKILNGGEASVETGDVTKRRVVLVVARRELHKMGAVGRRVIHEFERAMTKSGWSVEFRAFNFYDVKRPRKSWDGLITECDPFCVIALSGRPVLIDWVRKHGRRIAFCGGVGAAEETRIVAVSNCAMLEESMTKLIASGHRRVIYPQIDRSENLREKLEAGMMKCYETAGIDFSRSVHMPIIMIWDQGAYEEMIVEVLDHSRPDAILCSCEDELAALLGVMMRKGLVVGKDIAVVLMGQLDAFSWFRPEIASFKFPQNRLTRGLVRICEAWYQGHDVPDGLLKADFIEGDSISRKKLSA